MVQGRATVGSPLGMLRPLRGGLCGMAALAAAALATTLALRPAPPTAPAEDVVPLVLTLGPGGRDLRLYGDFTEGVAERMRAALAANPRVERIHLTSDGGLVDEARLVAGLVAQRRLVTYVPDYCVSACTLVFVAGRTRALMQGARLGFHAPFETDEAGREVQVDGSEEARDYVAAGVAPDFAEAAVRTPTAEIWTPDAERLLAAGVVTEVVGSARFPDSTLDAGATFARARQTVLRNVPLLAFFETNAPAAVDAIAAWYLAGYRAGRSEGEALDGLRALADIAARKVLAGADAPSVAAYVRLVTDALGVGDDDAACDRIGQPANVVEVSDALGREGTDRVGTLLTAALARRPTRPPVATNLTAPPPREAARGCATLRDLYASASPADATLRDQLFGTGGADAWQLQAAALPPGR